jgi:hypothetical protein
LFQPTIAGLLKERDKVLADWQVRHPDVNAYEDRDLEITSIKEISVENQITAIGDALKKKKQT